MKSNKISSEYFLNDYTFIKSKKDMKGMSSIGTEISIIMLFSHENEFYGYTWD